LNAPSIRHAPPFATPAAGPKIVVQLYEADYSATLLNDTGEPDDLDKLRAEIYGRLSILYGHLLFI